MERQTLNAFVWMFNMKSEKFIPCSYDIQIYHAIIFRFNEHKLTEVKTMLNSITG
jgi:hypothetical protein